VKRGGRYVELTRHEQRERVAYHEAGHAVALVGLGLTIAEASVRVSWFGRSVSGLVVPREEDEEVGADELLVVGHAGIAAEIEWWSWEVDAKTAVRLAEHNAADDLEVIRGYHRRRPDVTLSRSRARSEAVALVRHHWRGVEAVAGALYDHGRVNTRQVRRLARLPRVRPPLRTS